MLLFLCSPLLLNAMRPMFILIVDLLCFATCASALSISEHGVAHVFENGTAEMDQARHFESFGVCMGTIAGCMPLCV